MRLRLQTRTLAIFALLAIAVVLFALLVPHGHATGANDWLAMLPILFVGLISPLSLLPRLAVCTASRVPDAPLLPASFQRPPPFRRV
jgi:hypothetical protein